MVVGADGFYKESARLFQTNCLRDSDSEVSL